MVVSTEVTIVRIYIHEAEHGRRTTLMQEVMNTHVVKGGSTVGTIDVVFAQVEKIHIEDRAIRTDGRPDIEAIQPIARMGYFDYAVVRETFEMRVPGSDDDARAGLEGRIEPN